ncbi:MAG: hypothetical protein WC482_03800 [Candidatus Omnitrophota bacterium]|nr:hypothetical protein [Candidatus Omnitrophota bacterium]
MNKVKWPVFLALFFLVQSIASSSVSSFENNPLNPPTNIDINYSDPAVKKIYDAVCVGLFLYELDTISRSSKEEIESGYCGLSLDSGVSFDLANMDIGKKGWTRYYPFSIGNKAFIMRIFLTSERAYQPSAPILYEGAITVPAVTFQVLPSLNEILSDCKIKPRQSYSSSEVDRSS